MMPLLSILWANPWHKWPLVLSFFLWNEILPRMLDRLRYDRPKEVSQSIQHHEVRPCRANRSID